MGTLKLGAKNGAVASLVSDNNTESEAVITLPKSTGTLVTTTDLDKLMDLDGDGILDVVDLGARVKAIEEDYLSKSSGDTVTGTVKHKKEILIEPSLPNRFVDIKNRFPTNEDGSDAGSGGSAFGINFDLDHGNSGYNSVQFTNRDGNILAINGGANPAVKYRGSMTNNLHIVTKGYVDTELAAATATIKELTVRLAKLEAKK